MKSGVAIEQLTVTGWNKKASDPMGSLADFF
jgi:hypothetical protein